MPKNCSIPGCTSRVKKAGCRDISFHRLPLDSAQREQWLNSIQRTISISASTRICSLHFEGGRKTSDVAVPTIFPWSKEVELPKRKPPRERVPIPPRPKKPKLEDKLRKDIEIQKKALNDVEEKLEKSNARVKDLVEENEQLKRERVECFGLQRFQGSSKDI